MELKRLRELRVEKEEQRLETNKILNKWNKQGKNIIREDELLNQQNYGEKHK